MYHLGVKLLLKFLSLFSHTLVRSLAFFFLVYLNWSCPHFLGVSLTNIDIQFEKMTSFTQYLSFKVSSLTIIGWSHWNLCPLNVAGSGFHLWFLSIHLLSLVLKENGQLKFSLWILPPFLCSHGFAGAWVVPMTLKDFSWVLSWLFGGAGGNEKNPQPTNLMHLLELWRVTWT